MLRARIHGGDRECSYNANERAFMPTPSLPTSLPHPLAITIETELQYIRGEMMTQIDDSRVNHGGWRIAP